MEILRPQFHFGVSSLNYFILGGFTEHFRCMNENTHTSNRDMLLHALPWASIGHIFLTCIGFLVLHIVHRNANYGYGNVEIRSERKILTN
jgi:hypothetical protein